MLLAAIHPAWWVGFAVALLLVLLLAGVLLWRRRSAGAGAPRGEPLWSELRRAWHPVWRDLSLTERQLSTAVVALGDSVWNRTTWLEQLAGSPVPSAAQSLPLRVHRGERLLVLRFSDDVWLGDAKAAEEAMGQLARELPNVVLLVCAVDFRELHGGCMQQLGEWAQAIGRRLPLLARHGRSLGVRICVTGLESEPGYTALRELWLAEARSPLSFEVLEDRERSRHAWQGIEAELGSLLGAERERFESAVRLADHLPERLHLLSAFSRPLDALLRAHTRPGWNGVFLTDAEGNALPKSPFALNPGDRIEARAGLRRAAWRRTWVTAGVACGLLLLVFLAHGLWLSNVAERVATYRALVESTPQLHAEPPKGGGERVDVRAASPDAGAPAEATTGTITPSTDDGARTSEVPGLDQAAQRAGAGARGLRFWALPFAAANRRASLAQDFVDTTRAAFIEPVLASRRSFARRVFAAVLDRAAPTNPFGELVLRQPESWAAQLHMPRRTVGDFVHVRSRLFPSDITPRELDAAAQSVVQWRRLVMDLSAGVDAGVFPLELLGRARRHPLLRELPESGTELRLLRQAVALLALELAGRFPEDSRPARDLEAELRFVERNLNDLVVLRSWLDEIPDFGSIQAPMHLADLLDRVSAPAKEEEADAARVLEVRFDPEIVRIPQQAFEEAVRRTRARAFYVAFLRERCSAKPASAAWLEECPYLRAGYDGSAFFPASTNGATDGGELEPFAVRGPNRGGYGPALALPGVYTHDAFTTYVAPALTKWVQRLDESLLLPEDRRSLTAFIDGHIEAYGERYDKALRAYFGSMRFQPINLGAARSAVAELAAPGSWFLEFVGTAARHADLPLEGLDAGGLRSAVALFAGLIRAGGGKGPEAYAKLLLALLAEIDGSKIDAAGASGKRLAEALAVLAALEAFGGEVGKWLDGEQLVGEWRRPFEVPLDSLRAHAVSEISRYWYHEVVRPALPLLRRYPFGGEADEVAVSIEALTEEFGPQGRLWTTVEEVLAPLVVAVRSTQGERRRQWTMRPHVPPPEGLLEYLDAAERLTTLLWSEDGEPRKLRVRLTPLELPSGTFGEPLIALAYLSLAGAGMQSFNQVSDETGLQVPWWSREASSLTVEVLDEHASEVKAHYEAASMPGPWSFFKLLDSGCGAGRKSAPCGELSWPVKKLPGHPLVRFELTEHVAGAFRELSRLATQEGVPVR